MSKFSPAHDLPAGLVVFLVALPLCLGIALASDAPLLAGIVSGVVGGVLVGLLSGSHTAVSGPAAGLTVVVASAVHQLGSFQTFLAAVIAAGVLQVALGALRAGFVATLIPSTVIRGMLASIGIILILKQIPHALGRDDDFEGDESFWFLSGQENTFTDIAKAFLLASPGVVLVSVVGLVILAVWDHPIVSRRPWTRLFPGPLVVVVAGVLINELYRFVAPSWVITDEGHLVQIPDLLSGAAVTLPNWADLSRPDVWMVGAQLAAIASLETLLSIEAGDRLDPMRRTTPPDRELLAQGVGNMVSGALGGLPMTAVIVRTSASLQSGARSRWASVTHGALLVVMVLALPGLLNRVPLGALAAVLLSVGYKLAPVRLFVDMYARGMLQFLPFVVTVIATVLTDLLTGVLVGLVVGVVGTIITSSQAAFTVVHEGRDWLIKFTRDVSFLHKYALRRALAQVPEGAALVIDGTDAGFVDPDIADQLERDVEGRRARGQEVDLIGMEGKFISVALTRAH